MISDDRELATVVERINRDLAAVHEYLGDRNVQIAKIRFPRGYLRQAVHFRQRIWFLRNETLRRNLAYAYILSDIFRWLINRTDLYGIAREMVIKEGICLAGAIAESITKSVGVEEGWCGRQTNFKQRCEQLQNNNVITRQTCAELHWLWDTRQNEHIFLVPDREHEMYELQHYNRAIRAIQSMKEEMNAYFTADIPF